MMGQGRSNSGAGSIARWLFLLGAVLTVGNLLNARDFGRTVPDVREVSGEEASEILETFRESRGGMDSVLEAKLIHFPRRGERMERDLWIRAGWSGGRLLTRVDLQSGEGHAAERFLLVGGASPRGWVWNDLEAEAVPLEGESLLDPLVEGTELTPFDLTAPYLDWADAVYEGSERVSGSPAHWFRFSPPQEWKESLSRIGVATVRVAVDTRFNAPIRAEYLNGEDEVVRTVEARSFQKFSETWIVRRLEVFDEDSRDRTELKVDDALVELQLSPMVFQPEGLASGYSDRASAAWQGD